MSNRSRALLFGLNYAGSDCKLNGCVNDCTAMAAFLKTTCRIPVVDIYTDEKNAQDTTLVGMIQRLYELAIASWRDNLDFAWIHYSGHGSYIADASADEADGQDECLVPSDFETAGMLTDDIVVKILNSFNPKTRIICIFDCCHSATIADVKYSWESASRVAVENIMCNVPSRVITISGCLDAQTSADAWNINNSGAYAGALTSYLLITMKENPKTTKDVFSLLAILRERLKSAGYDQVPKLCSTYNLAKDKVFIPF